MLGCLHSETPPWWFCSHLKVPINSFQVIPKDKGLKRDLMNPKNPDFGLHYLVPGRTESLVNCMTLLWVWIWIISALIFIFGVSDIIESFGSYLCL